ncbi:hypothetical protein UFOVP181_476 [uncultured Caudovirales phage]|uniref:Uncharacterized protein n=1 Tax=uncultured Caudovirales phage TaxID=2100421 RepID=A0A6J5KWJ7_9CAUD|nr:hypothetical protein UFOVP57_165 [uncultured Caudovirales phage]CAB5209439.1 hypothetical protein UFOVP181_476 [uncultured Caudovirales phage]
MRVALDTLHWDQARQILEYCQAHTIDPDTVGAILAEWASPLAMVDSNEPWVLDIPEEHVSWLRLKDLL